MTLNMDARAGDRLGVLSRQLVSAAEIMREAQQISLSPTSASILPGQSDDSYSVVLPEKLAADGQWVVRRY
jgi:hypothetical protein